MNNIILKSNYGIIIEHRDKETEITLQSAYSEKNQEEVMLIQYDNIIKKIIVKQKDGKEPVFTTECDSINDYNKYVQLLIPELMSGFEVGKKVVFQKCGLEMKNYYENTTD